MLGRLVPLRNQADYQVERPGKFADDRAATQAIRLSEAAIALRDQAEADPARRAAAAAYVGGTLPP